MLVLHDMLGMTTEFSPRFLRRYLNLDEQIGEALTQYVADVKAIVFPSKDEQY